MTDRLRVKKLVKMWLAVLVIAIIVGYGSFQAKILVKGPWLEISSPADGSLLGDSFIEIEGRADNISFLTLNGGKIYTDESGVFNEKVLLSYGYNVMKIEAKDRFGRKTEKTLQLIYK